MAVIGVDVGQTVLGPQDRTLVDVGVGTCLIPSAFAVWSRNVKGLSKRRRLKDVKSVVSCGLNSSQLDRRTDATVHVSFPRWLEPLDG